MYANKVLENQSIIANFAHITDIHSIICVKFTIFKTDY